MEHKYIGGATKIIINKSHTNRCKNQNKIITKSHRSQKSIKKQQKCCMCVSYINIKKTIIIELPNEKKYPNVCAAAREAGVQLRSSSE